MPFPPLDTPALPCPECRSSGVGGNARIGNRRHSCGTCNRFNQRVMRMTRSKLKGNHPREYESLKLEVERDLYRRLMDETADE